MTFTGLSKNVRKALWAAAILVLLVGAVLAHVAHVRASAKALIDSALAIRSTPDAERVIADWRRRSGATFWTETSGLGGDHTYDGQIHNLSLARFHLTEPTAVTLGVTMRQGKLRSVTLTMSTGRTPQDTAAIWAQEWFEPGPSNGIHVSQKDRPRKAMVEFSSDVPDTERIKAFEFDAGCLVRLGGCKNADEMLPGVWQLAAQ